MHLIKRAEALELLVRLVAQTGPEYRYQRPVRIPGTYSGPPCVYLDPITEAPSCGIGRVLADQLGVSTDVLGDLDRLGQSTRPHRQAFLEVLGEEGYSLTRAAAEVWRVFQTHQDNETAYGYCLTIAREDTQVIGCDDTQAYVPGESLV